jgi:hypothetical protein
VPGAADEIAPEEPNRMRDALKPVYNKYSKELGEDIVMQVVTELGKSRASNQ